MSIPDTPPLARSSLHATAARLAAVATALLLVMFLVLSVSRAAFTATTENAGNSISAGDLALTDDDGEAAMFFELTDIGPNDPQVNCIKVTYTGDFDPAMIRFYVPADLAPAGDLAPYLDVKVELGAPASLGGFGDCTGFVPDPTVNLLDPGVVADGTLANMAANKTDYSSGYDAWDPSASDSRVFRFTVEVRNDAGAIGQSATGWGFRWETQTT